MGHFFPWKILGQVEILFFKSKFGAISQFFLKKHPQSKHPSSLFPTLFELLLSRLQGFNSTPPSPPSFSFGFLFYFLSSRGTPWVFIFQLCLEIYNPQFQLVETRTITVSDFHNQFRKQNLSFTFFFLKKMNPQLNSKFHLLTEPEPRLSGAPQKKKKIRTRG